LPFGIHDLDGRVLLLVAAFHDHLLGEAGLFIDLLTVGDAFSSMLSKASLPASSEMITAL
jgi:hypothetical protein